MDLEFLCQTSFAHHQRLIDEAARRRLRLSGRRESPASAWPLLRSRLATWLRGIADRVEPAPQHPQVRLLRAVAHHELDVDQALRLLAPLNGHRSHGF